MVILMESSPEDLLTQDVLSEEEEPVTGYLLDTRTSQMDDALLEKFEQAIQKQTALYQHHNLVKIAVEHDPIDLAKASTRLPLNARLVVYRNLPDIDAKVSFIIHTTSPTRIAVFRAIQDEEMKQLIENMPPDEAVQVLEDLPLRRLKRVFELLDEKKARCIAALQEHRRDTAGRLMTNEFFAFPLDTTVGRVVDHIRDNPGVELTGWVFVLGDDMELLGYVPDRNLIVNPPQIPLRKLMRPVVHRVPPEMPRDEVVELFERYRLAALPVIDSDDRLIGVITQGDIVEMMEEMADETIANIGGTAERLTEDEPTWRRFLARAPWLIVTLFAGILSATGFSIFQHQPWFLAVPFFVPLITGMSGNVGIQCSTVLIRSMATGGRSANTVGIVIARELKIGMLIGVCFGVICGVAAYALNHAGLPVTLANPLLVGTIVSSGVLGACFTATLLGSLSPIFFAKFRIDPAIASGPIVTAFNDVLATYMYFLIAWFVATVFEAAA
jgi:magnesium transporter